MPAWMGTLKAQQDKHFLKRQQQKAEHIWLRHRNLALICKGTCTSPQAKFSSSVRGKKKLWREVLQVLYLTELKPERYKKNAKSV